MGSARLKTVCGDATRDWTRQPLCAGSPATTPRCGWPVIDRMACPPASDFSNLRAHRRRPYLSAMTKPFQHWTVLPHGELAEIDDGLLTVVGQIKMPLTQLPRRMTVARLRNSRLAIWSAIALNESGMAKLETYGRPAFLIVPNHLQSAPREDLEGPLSADASGRAGRLTQQDRGNRCGQHHRARPRRPECEIPGLSPARMTTRPH